MSALKRLVMCCVMIFVLGCTMMREAKALSLCSLLCSCTMSSGLMSFGNYDTINSSAVSITGNVGVSCQLLAGLVSLSVPYTVSLDKGLNGTFATRQMLGPSTTGNLLNYNLFSNMGMTTVWGDGTGITQTLSSNITVISIGAIVSQSQTIYGLIPANQNVRWGSYSDTVTATVAY